MAILKALLGARLLDERISALYRLGKITGGVYSGIGNEATSVGSAWPLETEDVIVPTHRDLGAHLLRGHTPLEVLRQSFKRATSQTRGKDSGLHLGREGTNIVGMISHLAHMMPVAVGVALAERLLGRNTVVLTTVGDGSTSLGDFHEALNFAAVKRLPVVFVIVNNQYAYSTPNTIQYACAALADRALGYGMPGERVDGTDVLEVRDAAVQAVERARRGEGPTLLECVSMRLRGHSEHDDFKYVPEELLEGWRSWDPVDRFAHHLVSEGIVKPETIDAMKEALIREIDEAEAIAWSEPLPAPSSAATDVYRLWRPEWNAPLGQALASGTEEGR